MKKTIAILLALCAAASVTVSALAAEAPATQEPAAQARTTQEQTTQIAAKLTEADALAAALKDAGEKEADVTVKRNKLSEKETEDGQALAVYSVKFSTGTTSYKYYVDGTTGAILYKSVEFQSPDVTFKSRGRGDKTASGETAAPSGRSRRSDGRSWSDAKTGAPAGLTDTVNT